MIWKNADDRKSDLELLEQLRANAPATHQARIQKKIANVRSGQKGERDAAHFLNREFGTSQTIGILHDLRLEHDGEVAQIDHLVIHRYQATAWVLETKNYAGRITCDEHDDWTVWNHGKPRSIPSPLNQARRQCELLRQFLEASDITKISKIQPVVLISPTSSVDRSKLPADAHIVKSDNFGAWWRKQSADLDSGTALRMMGKHLLSGFSKQDFTELGQRLAAAHRAPTYDWPGMLGLDIAPNQAALASAATDQRASTHIAIELTGDGPWTFETAHGKIKVNAIPDGRYAVRNDQNDRLIEAVKTSCRGHGQWNARFRNWLIAEEEINAVLAAIMDLIVRAENPPTDSNNPDRQQDGR